MTEPASAACWQSVCKAPVTFQHRRPSLKRVLIVDTEQGWQDLPPACADMADVEVCGDFDTARRLLLTAPPELLVTNLRLRAHNGLHLVYLASLSAYPTRSIVYSRYGDAPLLREAQALGAFVESAHRVTFALPAYLGAELPGRDRRSAESQDRRKFFRGGRRAADLAIVA